MIILVIPSPPKQKTNGILPPILQQSALANGKFFRCHLDYLLLLARSVKLAHEQCQLACHMPEIDLKDTQRVIYLYIKSTNEIETSNTTLLHYLRFWFNKN